MSNEMASSAVRYLERAAEKLASTNALTRVGLAPAKVRALLAPVPAAEIRRAAARAFRKGSKGQGPIPRYVVAAIYADYLELGLKRTAAIYGRSRQCIHKMLRFHGLAAAHRTRRRGLTYGGVWWSLSNTGHLHRRERIAGKLTLRLLHHEIYEKHFGPIPDGHTVLFRNGNHWDVTPMNLECVSRAEATRRSRAARQRKAA